MLVAHGTKDPAGLAVLADVREAVGRRLGVPVSLSYVDVATPLLSHALAARTESLVVPLIAPLFMARGFHVEVDVPRAAGEIGAPDGWAPIRARCRPPWRTWSATSPRAWTANRPCSRTTT